MTSFDMTCRQARLCRRCCAKQATAPRAARPWPLGNPYHLTLTLSGDYEGTFSKGDSTYICAAPGDYDGTIMSPYSMDAWGLGKCSGFPKNTSILACRNGYSWTKDMYTTHYQDLANSEKWDIRCRFWQAVRCYKVPSTGATKCMSTKVLRFMEAHERRILHTQVSTLAEAQQHKFLRTMHEEVGLCALNAMN